MSISRAQMMKELLPGLNALFGLKYQDYDEEHTEIYDMEPNIAPVYFCGLIFEGSRHTINPIKVSKKIFEKFLLNGGSFLNKKITAINNTAKGITIISENSAFDFDNIVISAGSWSNELALMVGDKFPLDTERGYHVLFDNEKK